jgi:hypothetical protein
VAVARSATIIADKAAHFSGVAKSLLYLRSEAANSAMYSAGLHVIGSALSEEELALKKTTNAQTQKW